MAFRRKVDDNVGAFLLEEFVHPFAVAYIQLCEPKVWIIHYALQSRKIARVGQFIQTYDTIVGIFFEHMKYKVTADKPGASGYDYCHLFTLSI